MITNNFDSQGNKSLLAKHNQNTTESSRSEIAKITICLTDDHLKCSGNYIDSVTGKYFIKCLCPCHLQEPKKEDKNQNLSSKKTDIKSPHAGNNSSDSGRIWCPYTSIAADICWCGHHLRQHSRKENSLSNHDESCDVEGCDCKRFDE